MLDLAYHGAALANLSVTIKRITITQSCAEATQRFAKEKNLLCSA